MKDLPKSAKLLIPVLDVLKHLGGSGSNREIEEGVVKLLGLTEEQASIPHESDSRTEIGYRIAWAKTNLGFIGALENKSKAIWNITQKGLELPNNEPIILQMIRAKLGTKNKNNKPVIQDTEDEPVEQWKEELLSTLKKIDPKAFVYLSAWILRSEGFETVEITDGAGDRGIDGVAERRINLFTERVYFQSKRYKGRVSPDEIRDFQGSTSGKHGKFIFFTTGYFTAEAREAARRDGSIAIELIDGREFCDLLKRHKIGAHVRIKEVEEVTIDYNYLKSLEKSVKNNPAQNSAAILPASASPTRHRNYK